MPALSLTLPQLRVLLALIEARWGDVPPRDLHSLNLAEVQIRAAIKASEPKCPE
jgi:hypothetical protein